MLQKRPIFFFAFANDRANRLQLEKEERAVREALRIKDSEGQIEYKSIGQTNLTDIYNTFNSFHNRIYIFHYGGHSDSEFLSLSEMPARTEQLAVIMGQQQYLKLIFLNGCANYEQVQVLSKHGVPVIIATHAKINDDLSCHLAEQFYVALAAGKTIRQAFAAAASYLQLLRPGFEVRYRSLEPRHADQDTFPWGIYAENEVALDWHIGLVKGSKEKDQETVEVGSKGKKPHPFFISLTIVIVFAMIWTVWYFKPFGAEERKVGMDSDTVKTETLMPVDLSVVPPEIPQENSKQNQKDQTIAESIPESANDEPQSAQAVNLIINVLPLWKDSDIMVDGEAVEPLERVGTYITLALSLGSHKIRLLSGQDQCEKNILVREEGQRIPFVCD